MYTYIHQRAIYLKYQVAMYKDKLIKERWGEGGEGGDGRGERGRRSRGKNGCV